MVSTNYKTESRLTCGERVTSRKEGQAIESVTPFYLASGGDLPVDGGNTACRCRRVQTTCSFCLTRSRLSHHPGCHVLSGSQSRRHSFSDHCATRTSIRTSTRPESDDLHEFRRELDHHAAVCSRSQH